MTIVETLEQRTARHELIRSVISLVKGEIEGWVAHEAGAKPTHGVAYDSFGDSQGLGFSWGMVAVPEGGVADVSSYAAEKLLLERRCEIWLFDGHRMKDEILAALHVMLKEDPPVGGYTISSLLDF